jgi:hypothetical protein
MMVYEDFMRLPNSIVANNENRGRQITSRIEMRLEANPVTENPAVLLSLGAVLEKFMEVLTDLDKLISENSSSTLESLGPQSPIKVSVQQIFWLISQAANPDESCLLFAEKIVGVMYKNSNLLAIEVYILVVRRFFDISKTLPRELKEWFLYNEDPVKID